MNQEGIMMKFIELKNDKITVILCSLGAAIYRVIYDNNDMMLSPINEQDFDKEGVFYNKTIGRVTGRILKNDQIILHGGPHGLCHQEFNFVKEDNKVIFTYTSLGDESSYEGTLQVKVTYTLIDNELITETELTPNQKMEVSLTNHSFFCLGTSDINELSLKLDSDSYVVYDEKLLPLRKETIKDKYNFHKYTNVMKYEDIDNYFILKNSEVLLQSNKYQLKLITDYQGVHLFTDYFPDGVITRLTNVDHHRALAIEPQDDKTANLMLEANKVVKRTSKYIFSKII